MTDEEQHARGTMTGDLENLLQRSAFARVIYATLFYLSRAGAAWMIAQGFWYFEVVRFSIGTTKYIDSPLIDTGRNFIFIGILVILIVTGDLKDVKHKKSD